MHASNNNFDDLGYNHLSISHKIMSVLIGESF